MRKIHVFDVAPAVPPELAFLEKLALNFWWCWNPEAIALFQRIDPQRWRDTEHNPLAFLSSIRQQRLQDLAGDDSYLSHQAEVQAAFETRVPLADARGRADTSCTAYFSLEYGIHESFRLYSGGLGVLAGDHLKAASDLHLPLVAVGLMYRQGYFQQYLNSDGWQQERYPENEIAELPVEPATGSDGRQLEVGLPLPEGQLKAAVWRVDVGRVPLYLLDTNVQDNPPALREITAQLYDPDRTMRLRQELLLGIGGYRALVALGHTPRAIHMNEGHAAFTSFGAIEQLVRAEHLDVDTAQEVARSSTVFTTHTPVPAGNEAFAVDLVRPHLVALQEELRIPADKAMTWGLPANAQKAEAFSMTVLGLRMSRAANGVSELHGSVARRMWQHLWPARPQDEVPIGHVTNGIHVMSWVSSDNAVLYDRYLGPQWRAHPTVEEVLDRIGEIPDEELWRAHEIGRSRLIRTVRYLAERQSLARSAPREEIAQARASLDLDVLTIGFARRFATYKRSTLLLREPERLEALLTSKVRPVQFIFAGKAHPADDHGKDLIRQIVSFARKAGVAGKIVFLENYNIYAARSLVQGVDVWLNTPRRPHEASGTSGIKAAVNGGLHLSTLDGWWCEGYSPDCGWAIGHGEEYDDVEYQDMVECQALYNIIENEVVPAFYSDRSADIPERWVRMMKASIRMALAGFTSRRMTAEYSTRFYGPAMQACTELLADDARLARERVTQRNRLASLWHGVYLDIPTPDRDVAKVRVGDTFAVTTRAHLGDLRPEEVDVQVYHGPVNSLNAITESHAERMEAVEQQEDGAHVYRQTVTCRATGRFGFTARATPRGVDHKGIMPELITWADGADK